MHPFDQSCVERDMMVKAFGRFWDVKDPLTRKFWTALLKKINVTIPRNFSFQRSRIMSSPYPGHYGGGSGEIADIVLLDPSSLNFCLDAKRPGERLKQDDFEKVKRAQIIAKANTWPQPVFGFLGTNLRGSTEEVLVFDWNSVIEILDQILGEGNSHSVFLRKQIELMKKTISPSTSLVINNAAISSLLRLDILPSGKWVQRPKPHYSFRSNHDTPVLAVPYPDGGADLRFKEIPDHLRDHVEYDDQNYFARCFGHHKYRIYLPNNWACQPDIQRAVIELVGYAFS